MGFNSGFKGLITVPVRMFFFFWYVADSLFAWYLVSEIGFYFLVLVCVCVCLCLCACAPALILVVFLRAVTTFRALSTCFEFCAISSEPATAQPCMRRI